ncbi:MAG: hypothetical protein ABEJ84_08095 [Halodesulfurarchaeum sp.]
MDRRPPLLPKPAANPLKRSSGLPAVICPSTAATMHEALVRREAVADDTTHRGRPAVGVFDRLPHRVLGVLVGP